MVFNLNRAQGTARYHFVSVTQLFSGHGPCGASATQYVRGLDANPYWASYHPNATGNQVIANRLFSLSAQDW
jgi:hypothetical protein